ncbi:hypothetical protein PoB_004706000 [Plakobranchus ocellatus]|uniref:Uncharacterized protein n=1 Tax=Plakobranchus ocellatus TaxID=259542 RepID=A0AAV4BMB6_9GAST|nr:hypothetical protein PoB_004706000 [Plakobranchus ocellatus]
MEGFHGGCELQGKPWKRNATSSRDAGKSLLPQERACYHRKELAPIRKSLLPHEIACYHRIESANIGKSLLPQERACHHRKELATIRKSLTQA